jgi:hypothetical protein
MTVEEKAAAFDSLVDRCNPGFDFRTFAQTGYHFDVVVQYSPGEKILLFPRPFIKTTIQETK